MSKIPRILLLLISLTTLPAWSEENSAVISAMEEYLDFVEYGGAAIFPEQIPTEDWKNFHIVDVRDPAQFERNHIPGAINIEWRQILARRSELPEDKPVLVYCNIGTLSAQAGFALRVAGYDNVRILNGGFREFNEMGGFEAYERALKSSQQ